MYRYAKITESFMLTSVWPCPEKDPITSHYSTEAQALFARERLEEAYPVMMHTVYRITVEKVSTKPTVTWEGRKA